MISARKSTPFGATPGVASSPATRAGIVAMLPMIVAYAPFALVVGAAVAEHGSPLAGWAGSWLIFGGSSHLATISTLDNAGAGIAILTGLLINSRLVVYSASLARRWPAQPTWFRVAAAALIIDPTWAAADRHADLCKDPAEQRRYFIAAGLTLGCGWSLAIAVGALARSHLGALDLDIAIPLCLLGLVGSGLRTQGGRAVIVVAAATSALTTAWPDGSGLLVAVVAGTAVGLVSDRQLKSDRQLTGDDWSTS